jgi:sulfoxide reductase heme-binding subunit YedZ
MSAAAWYVARSGGIVAYCLLTASVVLGLLLAGRRRLGWPRFAVEELHRTLSLLTGVFVIVHGGGLLLDRVVPFSLAQELVPFTAGYRPLAVGFGVLSAELRAAIGLTNLLRARLPYRFWRRAHYLTLLVWLGSTVHLLLVGTDRRDTWLLFLVAAGVAAVAGCGLVRLRRLAPAGIAVGLAASVAAALALAFVPQPSAHGTTARTVVPARFAEPLTATVSQPSDSLVSVVGTAGDAQVRLDLLLFGRSVERTSLQLRFGSTVCAGTISALGEGGAVGRCSANGASHPVRITWRLEGDEATGELVVGGRSAASATTE